MLGSEGQAHRQSSFCPSPVTHLCLRGQNEGPRLFSKPAGWPTPDGRPRPPGRQSGPTSPSRWDRSVGNANLPARAGTDWSWASAPHTRMSASPALSLDRTSSRSRPGQPCPEPLAGRTQGLPVARGPRAQWVPFGSQTRVFDSLSLVRVRGLGSFSFFIEKSNSYSLRI